MDSCEEMDSCEMDSCEEMHSCEEMDSCEEMSSIIYMDPVLYEAAGAGDIGPFENYQTCLDRLLTPDENTILHIYLRNQGGEPRYAYFVVKILERCPRLLLQANKKGETPLHLAAKYGHSNVVKVLIGRAKARRADPESGVTAMLRMTNGEGDTALHEAARNARSHVVEILTTEDPYFSYSANVHGETPLYIAASVGWGPEQEKVIDEILGNCMSVDYGGPNGRTALHAAITATDKETTRKILEKEKRLTKTTDDNGWTPLHYAAYFSPWGDISAVKVLLECDVSAAYIAETTEKKRTALHIAAIQGCVDVMKEIVSRCPDCCELVDNRGWNALHYVVATKDSKVFKKCLEMIPELKRLKTEKDDKGNTPFHLIAALTHKQKEWNEVYPQRYEEITGIYGLNKHEVYPQRYEEIIGIYGLNKQELSITNIRSGHCGEIQNEIVESLEDIGSGPFGFSPFRFSRRRRDKNREEALNKAGEEALNKAREEMNDIIYMDPVLYVDAAAGNVDPFENHQTCLDRLLTPDESTILHVYLRNKRREPEPTDFVDRILEMCPPLLLQANKNGETPLHLAAKYGHSNVVKVLIDRVKALPADPECGFTATKRMLRMTNGEGDTALQEAARNGRGHVVEILTKEDPDFSYSANVHGETPLYIAASVGWGPEQDKVIDEILRNCISVDYGGPNGRTALHAAVTARDPVTTRKILKKEKKLTKATDENGWSPLHYAAYFSPSFVVKELLECDASAAYIAEKEKKRTALHIAAIKGDVTVMKEIVSRCPACCDLVDNRGWNALHYVVASQNSYAFKECLREIPELERLKTEKDEKGNTPFHLIAALTHKQEEWYEVYPYEESGILYGFNKQMLSIDDIRFGDFGEIQNEIVESLEDVGSGLFGGPFIYRKKTNKEIEKKIEEDLNKARESHQVVAALIATVTFAAAFTLPGGYKSDQGTAILAKKAAFMVFVISDAISMVLSISAVFIHFLLALSQGSFSQTSQAYQTTAMLFAWAKLFTMIGMGTMIIAFIAGTYAVLEPVLGLAINICLIGLSFFFLVCWIIYKDKDRRFTSKTTKQRQHL